MVGVPGRSKGCNTCIQRKIRCDQEIPQCRNCRKSNRLCTGYKRRQGYVLSWGANTGEPVNLSNEESAVTYQGRWRKSKDRQLPLSKHRAVEIPLAWEENPQFLSLPRRISSETAVRHQLHYLFLTFHLPVEILEGTYPTHIAPMVWLLHLLEVVIESPALEISLAALCAARVGWRNNDMDLVHQSRPMYAKGLEELRRALGNPRARLLDETLAACLVLSAYEVCECPMGHPNAYSTHRTGSMVLLRLRGPEGCSSPLGLGLFQSLRSQTALESLIHNRESFLSQPEWMENPWKWSRKTALDELTDILFVLATIMQQFEETFNRANQMNVQDSLHDIISNYLKVDAALRTWYGNLEKSVSGPLYWPELSTFKSHLDNSTLEKVFAISFHFPAFVVAQSLTIYWSAMMVVHFFLMYVYNKLDTTSPTIHGNDLHLTIPFGQRSREHSDQLKTMVRNICQSVEYLFQERMGGLSAITLFPLLHGCLSCSESIEEGWDREIAWITESIARVQGRFNWSVKEVLGK